MNTPPFQRNNDTQLEAVAANIVHQIGDALYEALPADVAHDHFVHARQATNDRAIDFAKDLISDYAKNSPPTEHEALRTQNDGTAGLIATVATLIRQASGEHVLDAAQLAQVLVERGVTLVDQGRVYAAATVCDDGTVAPVSDSFATRTEAEHELAVLLGDDYYRDRRPFIATSVLPEWRPVDDCPPNNPQGDTANRRTTTP